MRNAHAAQPGAPLVGESAFDWPAEPLAAGGMAVVFQARDRRLPRDVILKHPRTHDVHGQPLDSETRAQFENRLRSEALVLARLQHPAIVTIHELGKTDLGAPFCVLERVEGRSLREILSELAEAEKLDGKPRTRERVELISNLQSIAEALTAAHERGIVHRDVNPNNILVGPRGEATLIDWGLAKDVSGEETVDLVPDQAIPIDQATADGTATIIAGTPPYVCLEQALGQPAHPSYDVYSFGATLYHVVAGHPPFADESPVSYLARLVNGERPPPANPRDPELSGIIDRAMASKVEARFSAAELWRALKEYLTGDLVFSHRYSLTGRAARWVRKNRAKAGLIAVSVLALVLVAVGWSIVRERTERSARLAAEAQSRAAARVAEADRKAAEEARRTAAAERDRAEALNTAALKDEEARRAQEEADRADKTSQTYKQLKEIADRKRGEADAARNTADQLAQTALKRAAEARDAQERAEAEAERTRREAQESVTAIGRERDQALADRRHAELERDQALTGRQRAEVERDDAIAGRQRAIADRDAALQARQRAEAERDEALRRLRELEAQRGSSRDAGP
jgi:tRNA A-37 threonylcarbamoyl transferase component Bud32